MPDSIDAAIHLSQARVRGHDLDLLRAHFGTLQEAIQASSTELCKAGLSEHRARAVLAVDPESVVSTQNWLDEADHSLLVRGDSDFPELLSDIDDPPSVLYVNGDVDSLHLPSIAIVGSRNPTRGGERNASDFAEFLAGNGFCIVSGLATGIDSHAHQGALRAGGKTVAFLGHGIDRVYPAANRELAHRIVGQGALVSEYPLGVPPDKRHFPQRNRLISGLTVGTLVVEAARRSGSLITARLAGEQGKEVFALPGSIHNPLSRGCHELIRSGAKLVENAGEIVSEVAHLTGLMLQNAMESTTLPVAESETNSEHKLVLEMLEHDPSDIDTLARQSGLTIDQLSSMLLILELEEKVEKLSGGQYAIIHQTSRS